MAVAPWKEFGLLATTYTSADGLTLHEQERRLGRVENGL
jgi:hypothetical protein